MTVRADFKSWQIMVWKGHSRSIILVTRYTVAALSLIDSTTMTIVARNQAMDSPQGKISHRVGKLSDRPKMLGVAAHAFTLGSSMDIILDMACFTVLPYSRKLSLVLMTV
jgi:hypothetical protein